MVDSAEPSGRGRQRGSSVLATGRVHPADARNLINPTPNTTADVQAMTDAANVGGVAIAATPRCNPVAQIQAGVGVIANADGPLIGPHDADPTVAQAGERIVAGPANVGDGQAPVHLNRTIEGLAAVVAPAPAIDVANVGGVAIAAIPRGNPVAQIQARVGVIANADGPLIGPHNAGVVPAGQAPAQLNLGGVAAMVAPPPALAQPYFDIESGLSGPPLRRSEVGPFF